MNRVSNRVTDTCIPEDEAIHSLKVRFSKNGNPNRIPTRTSSGYFG